MPNKSKQIQVGSQSVATSFNQLSLSASPRRRWTNLSAMSSLEELTVQQRENIALLKEKLDLNLGQVRAALAILGENDIPPERLTAKLVEIAERFKDLQATASAQLGDDPKIAALKIDAQKAIEVGELAR